MISRLLILRRKKSISDTLLKLPLFLHDVARNPASSQLSVATGS